MKSSLVFSWAKATFGRVGKPSFVVYKPSSLCHLLIYYNSLVKFIIPYTTWNITPAHPPWKDAFTDLCHRLRDVMCLLVHGHTCIAICSARVSWRTRNHPAAGVKFTNLRARACHGQVQSPVTVHWLRCMQFGDPDGTPL